MGREFKEIADYREIDWIAYRGKHGVAGLNQKIMSEVKFFQPDMVFMQIQTGGVIDQRTAYTTSGKSYLVNWTGDVRTNIKWYIDLAPYVGTTMFTNMTDVKTLKDLALRSDYLQIGYDEKIYFPGERSLSVPDIIFLGNNYSHARTLFPGTKERQDMVNFLSETYGDQFKPYGIGWKNTKVLTTKDEPDHYRSAKIAINQNHFLYERFSSDRIFRIMACGCFCLTRYYPGIEEEFTIGKHLEVWHDFEELRDQIDYYLLNEGERQTIARNGYKLVSSSCTWKHRIKQLLELYERYLDTRHQKPQAKKVLTDR
jgi:spore maturation protein CgeB